MGGHRQLTRGIWGGGVAVTGMKSMVKICKRLCMYGEHISS